MTTVFREPLTIDNALTYGCAAIKIEHGNLTAASTSQTLTWSTLATGVLQSAVPARVIILGAHANVITAFAGGGNTAVVLKLGYAGNDDELIEDVDIMATGIKTRSGVYTLNTYEAAYAPIVTVTTTTGTCLGLTAGKVELFIHYVQIPSISVIPS